MSTTETPLRNEEDKRVWRRDTLVQFDLSENDMDPITTFVKDETGRIIVGEAPSRIPANKLRLKDEVNGTKIRLGFVGNTAGNDGEYELYLPQAQRLDDDDSRCDDPNFDFLGEVVRLNNKGSDARRVFQKGIVLAQEGAHPNQILNIAGEYAYNHDLI